MKLLTIYLLLINALAFVLMLADKYKAKKKLWRIPEATLIGVAAFGGSIGALFGMYLVRHKTQHPKFVLGIPLILAVQAITFVFLFPYIKMLPF